jgi:hypothetical protein
LRGAVGGGEVIGIGGLESGSLREVGDEEVEEHRRDDRALWDTGIYASARGERTPI